ncbi:MAG: class I SAM-dependent methyltransferase [Gemmataceae bacterium]
MNTSEFEAEVLAGERFEFGKNWQRFLSVLNEDRVREAQRSLGSMLGVSTLAGKTFLDIGSGSGLFSLAAMRLGAERVHSFDFDPQSVACARELRRRYFDGCDRWTVEQGSVLDVDYLRCLGEWDIVYSWGVLHHTGDMWAALRNVAPLVRASGTLFLAIYNDQGGVSRVWKAIKHAYNKHLLTRWLISGLVIPFFFLLGGLVVDLLRMRNPLTRYREYKNHRGMSWVHDWFDWLGGYPFEVARPEEIFDFYRRQGFVLERLKTVGGRLGCNEFVFRKAPVEVATVQELRTNSEEKVAEAAPLAHLETAS